MEIPTTFPIVEIDTASLSNAMSQVKLRDVELTGLKQKNKNLKDIALKKEEVNKNMSGIARTKC